MIGSFFYSWIVKFSYIGLFAAGIVSTSTLFLPLPVYALVFFSQKLGLNPVIAAVAAGTGSALGELTGYLVGLGGSEIAIEKKKNKWVKPFVKYFKKYGFITIAITAFIPFPFDIVGILSGWSKYDIKKFFLATAIGKTGKCLLIAYGGAAFFYFVGKWLF